ncbi:MAG: A24 family peptidase C-terminal domain-containing protein [Methanomassiliicoccales archaeon]
MDWLPVAKVGIAFTMLALASWSDWRTRLASDAHWIVIGTFGLIFLAYEMFQDPVSPLYYLFLVPLGVLFFDIFWDDEGDIPKALHVIAVLVFLVLVLLFWSAQYFWELISIPAVVLVLILLYYLDIVKGGADVKALISLAIMFPVYPIFDGLPLVNVPTEMVQYAFPFTIVVLFNAALMVMVFPLAYVMVNLVRGDRGFPEMLFGYRMTIPEARKRFVWPMQGFNDGELKTFLFPREVDEDQDMFQELEEAGLERIWVTPKIPFLIPIAASLLVSAVVGNPLFLMFG